MKRSQLSPMPEYFDRYINQCDDVEIIQAIQTSIVELENAPVHKWKMLQDKTYAVNKWTIKEVLQHLIDTERIFSYRALAYARNEKQAVLSFDEDAYTRASGANARELDGLIEELLLSHKSVQLLFESFTPQMCEQLCPGFKGPYSVASVGFILPGHQRWHFRILEEKYYPLLTEAYA
jgi:hypothetical protein